MDGERVGEYLIVRYGGRETILCDTTRGRESPSWIHNSMNNITKPCVFIQSIIHVFGSLYVFFSPLACSSPLEYAFQGPRTPTY